MPQFRRLVDSFPLKELWFNSRLLLAEFIMDEIVLDQVFSEYYDFSRQYSSYQVFYLAVP
jgi:hypothetical protein